MPGKWFMPFTGNFIFKVHRDRPEVTHLGAQFKYLKTKLLRFSLIVIIKTITLKMHKEV